MRKKLLIGLLLFFCLLAHAQDIPSWVKQHPVNELGYAGVGMARTSEADYMNKAKEQALADLASEISIQISSSSLLNTVEDNGVVRESYSESIRATMKADVERFRLVDSWQGGGEYWVYYELNRLDYEAYLEEKRNQAIKDGFDFWYRGSAMMQQGDMLAGTDLLVKAWNAVKPVLHMDLRCSYNGKTVNLGTEVYASLVGAFNGVTLTVSPGELSGQAFQGIATPVKVVVLRNGVPLRNIQLCAAFIAGDGDLSSPAPTDENGSSVFYVRNLTSKQHQQEIRVSLAAGALRLLADGEFSALFRKALAALPEARLTIRLENKQLNAYIQPADGGLKNLAASIRSMLTNNYFNVVESPAQADVVVTMANQLKKGGIVSGELYNMVEYFSNLLIRLVDNRTSAVMLNYSLNGIRTLVPENKSYVQAELMVVRELLKRLKREFPAQIKSLRIDTEGEILTRNVFPVSLQPVQQEPIPLSPTEPIGGELPQVVPYLAVKPSTASTPSVSPVSAQDGTMREEWIEGVFLEYSHLSGVGSKSSIHCNLVNTTSNDVAIRLYVVDQTVINQDGEEMKIGRITIGSNSGTGSVTALIVPDIPTKLVIETPKLDWVALLSLKKSTGEIVKMRSLK